MRSLAASVLLMASAGCASTSTGSGAATVTEVRRIGVEEVIGLTRSELESRLGLPAINQHTISGAELENGALVKTVGAGDLVSRRRCAAGGHLQVRWLRGKDNWPMPPLIIRDGAIASFAPAPRIDEDLSLPAYLVVACLSKSSRGLSNDDAAWIIASPVLAPALLAMAAISASDRASGPRRYIDRPPPRRDINAPLGRLALGEPPPGGLESYVSKLPAPARMEKEADGEIVVGFYPILPDENHGRLPRATVTFRNGVAVRFQGVNCVLTQTRRYRCD